MVVMTRARTTLALVALALGVSGSLQPADAQVSDRVSFLMKISIDPSVGGTAIGAASGTIDGVPVSIDEASWTDTHSERSPLFEVGVAVRTGDRAEILGLFNYGRAGADVETIGDVGGAPLAATLDHYQFWGLEGGIRFRPASGVGPYVTVAGGFRRVSKIQARLRVDSAVREVTAYDASIVPSFAVGGGMLWGGDDFAMGFEVALRYAGSPAVPAGQALQPASDAGARWSLPVGLVFRF
jgi:hypothetical protein